MKTKIIMAALAVLLAAGAVWYVQGLRADNARLQADNEQLHVTLAANVAVIEGLKAQRAQDEQLLQQWANDQERIKQLQLRLNSQIQKELQTNEDFKVWAAGAYNADAYSLLQSADNYRVSDD